MADIIIKILEPATNFDLITLEELKMLLGITNTLSDPALEILITSYSDVIATMCNRVFAKEKLRETWRCLQGNRIFLSHYPIATEADIVSVECPRGSTMNSSGYEIELKSGKIELYQSTSEPIVVTYTGGYNLPDGAPPALKQAVTMAIREERREQTAAAVSGMKSLSHKESRVMFFDPNVSSSKSGGGSTSSAVPEAVKNLLMHYVRLQV